MLVRGRQEHQPAKRGGVLYACTLQKLRLTCPIIDASSHSDRRTPGKIGETQAKAVQINMFFNVGYTGLNIRGIGIVSI